MSRKDSSRNQQLPVRASASFLFGLEVAGKREAPTEFRVFPAGSFSTTKGSFIFSQRSADSVMGWYAKRQLPLMGDYEHMTDEPAVGRPPVIAPASITEMTPAIHQNAAGGPELWVENVKWTNAARKMLEEGEYRFFSPTFLHDPETKEVLALLRIALTNDPAINDLEPLVAATAGTTEEENQMADNQTCAKCAATEAHLNTALEQHKTLKAGLDDLLAQHKTLKDSHDQLVNRHQELSAAHEAMMKSFEDWAAEEAEEHEEATATATVAAKASLCARRIGNLRTLRRDLATLTGEKTAGAMLGKATAWKGGAGELSTLKAEIEKGKQEKLSSDFKAMADKACTDGKLSPAERKVLESKGPAFAMEFLTAKLGETTAPIVPITSVAAPSPDTSAMLTTLSAGTRDVIAQLFPGVPLEEAAKQFSAYQASLPKVLAARADK